MIRNKLNLLSFIIGIITISMSFAQCTASVCLSIENIGATTLDITMTNTEAVAGFQLDLDNVTISDATAGSDVPADWMISASASRVLGFTLDPGNNSIPPTTAVLVVTVEFSASDEDICMHSPIFSDMDGVALDYEIDESSACPMSIDYDYLSSNPTEFSISQNYPNPFNPVTNIHFDVAEMDEISLVVYDLLGKEIITLASGTFMPGSYTVKWDAQNNVGDAIASGMYIYRYISSNQVITRKMLYLK